MVVEICLKKLRRQEFCHVSQNTLMHLLQTIIFLVNIKMNPLSVSFTSFRKILYFFFIEKVTSMRNTIDYLKNNYLSSTHANTYLN